MARLKWDKTGERFFEAGVDHGVLYPNSGPGVPWNGLISIEEQVSGGETEAYYFDGIKYFDSVANEDFQATLQAFTYPDEFASCEGTVTVIPGFSAEYQTRQTFGLSWRTKVGNDIDGIEHSSKIHIVYGATAAPSSKSYQTLGDSPVPVQFEWTINAVPTIPGQGLGDSGGDPNVDFLNWMWPPGPGMVGWPKGPDGNTLVDGWWATPYVVIDEQDVTPDVYDSVIDRLNGTPETLPYLPSLPDLINLLNGNDIPDAPLDPNYVPPVDPNPGSDGNGVPESVWANAASVRPYQSLGRPGENDNFYAAAVTGGDLSLSDDNIDTSIAFGPYLPGAKLAAADARFHKLPFVPADIRVRFNVSLNLTLRDRHITPVLQLGLSNMDNTEIILSDTSQSIDMFGIQTDPVTGFDYIEFTFHGWNNTLYPDAWAKVLSGEFYAVLNNQTIDSGDANRTPDFWIQEMWLYYASGNETPPASHLGPVTTFQSPRVGWPNPQMMFGDPATVWNDGSDDTFVRITTYRPDTSWPSAGQNTTQIPVTGITGPSSRLDSMIWTMRVRGTNNAGLTEMSIYLDMHTTDFFQEISADLIHVVPVDGEWHDVEYVWSRQKVIDWGSDPDELWAAMVAGDVIFEVSMGGPGNFADSFTQSLDFAAVDIKLGN